MVRKRLAYVCGLVFGVAASRSPHLVHAALHVDAVVGVADGGVQFGEQIFLLFDPRGVQASQCRKLGQCDGVTHSVKVSNRWCRRTTGCASVTGPLSTTIDSVVGHGAPTTRAPACERAHPTARQFRRQPYERNGTAGRVQAGDVVADQLALHGMPNACQQMIQVTKDDVELLLRSGAQSADHGHHPVARRGVQRSAMIGPTSEYRRVRPAGVGDAPPTPLAVHADAQLQFAHWQLEDGMAHAGHGATGQRRAHAARLVDDARGRSRRRLPGDALASAAAPASFSTRTVAPMPRRLPGVSSGDVVVDQHGLDVEALFLGQLDGHAQLKHAAGEVLDDEEGAGAAVDGMSRRRY